MGELGGRQDRKPIAQGKQITVAAHKAIGVRGKQRGKDRIVPGVAGHAGLFRSGIDDVGLEPESVKTYGLVRRPPRPGFEIANCDFKAEAFQTSRSLRCNSVCMSRRPSAIRKTCTTSPRTR